MDGENRNKSSGKLLTRSERTALKRMQREIGYHKKKTEKQKKLMPKLVQMARAGNERIESERAFEHNLAVASKHERRVNVKRRWRIYTFAVTAAFVLLLVGYVLYSYIFVINSVTVSGSSRYTPEEILAVAKVEAGDKLFSANINEEDISAAVVKYFPYIKSVKLYRMVPNKVTLELIEEEPVFLSEIYGQYALLSEELRVLELRETEPVGDYIILRLPEVKSAVAGQVLVFRDDVLSVALRAAEAVASPVMREGTSVLNISDRFSIYVSYGGKYKLMIGDINDIDLKLSIAFEIMKDEVFATGNRGTIYLENINSPSVIIDNEINLD